MLLLALVILALPGLLLAIHLDDSEQAHDPVCLLTSVGVTAAAVWVVAFWVLGSTSLGLAGMVAAISGGSALGLGISWRSVRRVARRLTLDRAHLVALGVLAAVAAIRLVPFLVAPVAPGADMSMHSYMTRLIVEVGGIPTDYRPILPIEEFGAYAAGMPVLGALVAVLGRTTPATGAFLVTCLIHLATTAAVYSYVRRRTGVYAALLAALVVTVGTRDPQAHFGWGGNPTVLALVFIAYALDLLERLPHGVGKVHLVVTALVLAAAPLTHAVLPYALIYSLPPVLVYRLWRLQPSQRWTFLKSGLVVVALAAAAMTPYLLGFDLTLSGAEREWIQRWQSGHGHLPPGPVWTVPLNLIPFFALRLGPAVIVWLLAALVLRWRAAQRRAPRAALPVGATQPTPITEDILLGSAILLLTINAYVWVLPLSYLLYPDRIMLLLILPVARIIASTLDELLPRLRQKIAAARPRTKTITRAALSVFVAVSICAPISIWYLRWIRKVSVTGDDQAAIGWIARNTPRDAVIENNYGDAGVWIPALAWRAVSYPHANVVYLDEVSRWRKGLRADFLFIGAKVVYRGGDALKAQERLAAAPRGRYSEVFRQGQAVVYRVTGAGR